MSLSLVEHARKRARTIVKHLVHHFERLDEVNKQQTVITFESLRLLDEALDVIADELNV